MVGALMREMLAELRRDKFSPTRTMLSNCCAMQTDQQINRTYSSARREGQ
jgi:hypothetical protein